MQKILNNKLILGTVQMGLPYGINNNSGKISLQNSIEILEYAFNNGIETLDSAESYGNAHEVIGIFHNENPDKIFKVITKLPHQINDDIVKKVDLYLKELNVTQLDTLMFHSYASYKANIRNFDILKRLKLDKKIKNLGVSVYTNNEIEKVLLNDNVDVIQLPFNIFDNLNLRSEVLQKAKSKGKIIHTRSVLLQGLFFKKLDDVNKTVQSLKNELIQLHSISNNNKLSISELALGYCLNQKYIDNTLIGVDSIDQLKENLESSNLKLGIEVMSKINSIKVNNLNLLNPSLWK